MKTITPVYREQNKGHYSAAVLSNGMLYISGQLSLDPDTGEVPSGGIDEQVRLALANVERVLMEAGFTRNQVVQCRIYVTDIRYWDTVNKIYAEFFGAHKPARVIVPVTGLHFGCLAEIEAIAEAVHK